MQMDGAYCLVLSGGGAKGVYHIGAWKALRELGIPVCAFIGNSIGAIVAGFLAQGLDTELEALVGSIGIESVLKVPDELLEDGDLKLDLEALPSLRTLLLDAAGRGGFDTSPLKQLLLQHLDEATIRASGVDLGIVTINVSDLHPREVFLEAMEPGSLVDYLMASAALPGFASPVIGGKKYMDGGLHDNMPYAVARRRGYRRIILIDISGLGMNRRPDTAGSQTIYIKNSIDMGGVLDFDREFLDRFARLGYLDTMRVFGRCSGYSFFVQPDEEAERRFRIQVESTSDPSVRALSAPSSPLFPFPMRHDRRLLLKCLDCAASILELDRIRLYSYAELAQAVEGKRAAEDMRAETIIGASSESGKGSARARSKHLASIVHKAIHSASLSDPPYFYLCLARAAVGGRHDGLIEKALAAFVPELEAGMAWFDLGLRYPVDATTPEASLEGGSDRQAEATSAANPGVGTEAPPAHPSHPETDPAQAAPTGQDATTNTAPDGLVRLIDTIPDLCVDLRYASPDNAFSRQLYRSSEAWLLAGSATKLAAAEAVARKRGLRIVVLDAYRPPSAQKAMWEVVPDPDFVAPPERGSIHTRGAAVDVSLADAEGRLLPMPSDFDEFSERAAHGYTGASQEATGNRALLRSIMESAGFTAYENEWWHYVDPALRSSPLLHFEP